MNRRDPGKVIGASFRPVVSKQRTEPAEETSSISRLPICLRQTTLISRKPALVLFFGSQIHARNSFTERGAWRSEGDVGGLVGSQPPLAVNVLINSTVATSLTFPSSKGRRQRACWSGNKSHELQRGDFG